MGVGRMKSIMIPCVLLFVVVFFSFVLVDGFTAGALTLRVASPHHP